MLSFGDFVQTLCTYCLFEKEEIQRCAYTQAGRQHHCLTDWLADPSTICCCCCCWWWPVIYFIFDKDKNGYIRTVRRRLANRPT